MRVLWLLTACLLLASVIWGRLVYWQGLQHGELSKWAVRQYEQVVPLPPARGVIYDRELRPLAVNTTVYSVFVSPTAVPPDQRALVATTLSQLLGVDHDQLLGVLGSGHQFSYVARRQAKEKADQVHAAALPGVGLEPEQQRSYLPGGSDGSLAANLLGFVNFDGQGQYGVEGFYDPRLAGKAGYKTTYRDAAGRDIARKRAQTDAMFDKLARQSSQRVRAPRFRARSRRINRG